MDYTLSDSYTIDAGTGQRMHDEDKAIPTVVTDDDMNGIIWELMEIIKAGSVAPAQFNKAVPATYTKLLTALRSAGVFQTATLLDNTTKVATTAFVQAALAKTRHSITPSARVPNVAYTALRDMVVSAIFMHPSAAFHASVSGGNGAEAGDYIPAINAPYGTRVAIQVLAGENYLWSYNAGLAAPVLQKWTETY